MIFNLTDFNVPDPPATASLSVPPSFSDTATYSRCTITGGYPVLSQNYQQVALGSSDLAYSGQVPWYMTSDYDVLTAVVGTPSPGVDIGAATVTAFPDFGLYPTTDPGAVPAVIVTVSTDFAPPGDWGYNPAYPGLDTLVAIIHNSYGGSRPINARDGEMAGLLDDGSGLPVLDWFIGNGGPGGSALTPGTPVWIGCQMTWYGGLSGTNVTDGSLLPTLSPPWNLQGVTPGYAAVTLGPAPLLAVMDAGGWTAVGTADKPLEIDQAGTWRTYDGSGSSPLQVKKADGSWKTVSHST